MDETHPPASYLTEALAYAASKSDIQLFRDPSMPAPEPMSANAVCKVWMQAVDGVAKERKGYV